MDINCVVRLRQAVKAAYSGFFLRTSLHQSMERPCGQKRFRIQLRQAADEEFHRHCSLRFTVGSQGSQIEQ